MVTVIKKSLNCTCLIQLSVLVILTVIKFSSLQALDYLGTAEKDADRELLQGAALSAADRALLIALGDSTKIGRAERVERVAAAIAAGARFNIRLSQHALTAIEIAANNYFDESLIVINLILAAAMAQGVQLDQMSLNRALLWATGGLETQGDAVEQAEALMAAGADPSYIYKPGPDGDKKNILERKIESLNLKFQRGEKPTLNETLLLVALLIGGAKIRSDYLRKLPFVQTALLLANLEQARTESAKLA